MKGLKKFNGRKAKALGYTGVVCGNDGKDLIMAIKEIESDSKLRWHYLDDMDIIQPEYIGNELGYVYIGEEDLL